MQIPYPLLFRITCLQILASRKIHLRFFISYQSYRTLKFIATSSSTNFYKYFFCQGSQVMKKPFIKTNVTNSSFHLVKHDNWTKTVYDLSRYIYKSVQTWLKKSFLKQVGRTFGKRSTPPFLKLIIEIAVSASKEICHFIVTFTNRTKNYSKMIKCQIKEVSM